MIDLEEYHPDDYKLRDIKSAKKEVDNIVDIITTPTEEISLKTREDISKKTVRNFRDHINKGFLDYRKSVTEATGFAVTEWTGQGSVLVDALDRQFLDLLGGFGLYSYGIRHPKIVAAVKSQLDRSPQYSQEMLDPLRAQLAKILALLTPGKIQYGFFANSGTEAVDGAMKLAKLYTGKKGFISTLKAFHGKSLGALSLMGKQVFRKPLLPLLDGIRQAPFGDLNALEQELKSARAVGDDIAAVVLEPIQGEAGAIVPPDEYLPGVRELCDHYGVLMICDEVQTGFGRTGELFGVDHWDVKPDIMCFGKALGGGVVPMSAFMATPEIWKCMEPNPFMHTTTTGGNPLACASALAAISVLLEEDLAGQAKKKGEYVLGKLGELQERYPGILAKKRGLGLLLGMEFHTDGIGYKVASGLFSRGVITAGTLTNAKNIRFEPALNVPWEILDESLNRIEDVFKSIELPKGKPNEYLYTGQMLHVDLSNNKIQSKTIPKKLREQYIGGWGLATKYLYDTVDPKVDPLSEDNAVVIMTGPVCGTLVPTSSRTCLVSKSPKTNTIFESNIGGSFGPELKFAGYDGIIITGKAKNQVYLRIENNSVTLEDAGTLTGKGIFETEEWLKNEIDTEAKTLAIGPAGENLIDFACIGSESYRQMGRGGAGALFGSKNLKAIVCRGTGGVQVNEIGSFYEKVAEHTEGNLLTDDNMWAKTHGTPLLVDVTNEMGIHPTRNFTKGVSEGRQNLNADAIDDVKIGDRSCASCPMGCGKFTSINGTKVEGPEYETLCLGGSNCEINDLETVMKFNRLCDDYGLDTMSTGNIIGLAMDITESKLHDYGIKFGDTKEFLTLIEEIATGSTSRGKDLALGAQKLAEKHNAQDKAAHSKNLEMPAYDPRGNYGMALGYATSERGACHLRSFTLFEEEPFKVKEMTRAVMDNQNLNAVKFSMGLCDFWGTVDTGIMADFLTKGLGKKISAKDLTIAGERIWNLNKLFNLKAGFNSSDDTISDKLLKKVLENGPHENRKFDADAFEQMKALLYGLRGWDKNGIPSKEKLTELNLLDA
ncbi:MAG: putrescine aminotransferase [Desulfobacula sp.]|jgi:aldehyde:ferredoxin oxidoreductase|uniref:putrescine aminotransferase n=1 Tax=Desulfobacula sp. TaxID=2593537 RepID=UPI001EB0E8FE|nr:putrescine aminotransferase [Desulfobacula sp.]MBT4877949.1 putrescine aminotransferase [Desulfobacula sp.]MBT5546197.1 putrescine aminotransferase [Desulfobacula sp.]MBT7713054.1 putrescine aminotransferase [Deltaproteobacteria bacterium]